MALVSVEVIDAVQRSLEREGLLQSLRAQLKSNVIRLLSSDLTKTVVHPTVRYAESKKGRMILCLIREALQVLDFKHSLAVFESESNIEKFYQDSLPSLCEEMHLEAKPNVSLLEQLLEAYLIGPTAHMPTTRLATQAMPKTLELSSNSPQRSAKYTPADEMDEPLEVDDEEILEDEDDYDHKDELSIEKPQTQSRLQSKHADDSFEESTAASVLSPLSSPAGKPLNDHPSALHHGNTNTVAEAKKTIFDDDSFDQSSRDTSPNKSQSMSHSRDYGIKEDLDELVESMGSPDKPQIAPTVVSEEKPVYHNKHNQPTRHLAKEEVSMLEEIQEIAESFDANDEDDEDDAYDFESPSKKSVSSDKDSSPPTSARASQQRQLEQQQRVSMSKVLHHHQQVESKPMLDAKSEPDGDDSDDLPAYGQVTASSSNESSPAKSTFAGVKESPEKLSTPSSPQQEDHEMEPSRHRLTALPQVRMSQRLPFNSSDFLTSSNGSVPDIDKALSSSLPKNNSDNQRGAKDSDEDSIEELDEVIDEEDEEDGPEYESDEKDDGIRYSHLDTLDKQSPQDKNGLSDRRTLQVQSRIADSDVKDAHSDVPAARATVSRTQASTMRSTKGWNVSADDSREFDGDDFMDAHHNDVDQLSDSPIARIAVPGRRSTNSGSNQQGRYSNSSRHEDSASDIDDMEDIDADADNAQHDEDHSALHTSYRSNQDEENELVINQEEEEDEDEEDNDYEQDFADPDQSQLQADTSTALFTASKPTQPSAQQQKYQSKPEADEEDYDDDDYEDGFEDDDGAENKSRDRIPSVKASNAFAAVNKTVPSQPQHHSNNGDSEENSVEEEINSDIEDDDGQDMSVGNQSESEDDQGWGKARSAPASGLTKQRSGFLPTTAASEPAPSSSLNDFSDDDDDDDGLQAFSTTFNRSNKTTTATNQRSTGHSFARGGHHHHQQPHDHDESVMSENLSVGEDNSGEESFSMNDF